MFSWNENDKEFYFRKAQRILKANIPEGTGRIQVERDSFGVRGGMYAVVYLKALSVTRDKELIAKIRKLDGFKELRTLVAGEGASCLFRGSIEIKLRGKDR